MPGVSMKADPLLHLWGDGGSWGDLWGLVEVSSVLKLTSAAGEGSRGCAGGKLGYLPWGLKQLLGVWTSVMITEPFFPCP